MIIKILIAYFIIAAWNVSNEEYSEYCTDDGCPSFYNEEDKEYYADSESN